MTDDADLHRLERGNIDYLPLISYPDDRAPAEKTAGFEVVLSIATLSAVYMFARKRGEDKLKGGEEHGWQLWRFQEGKRFMLPLEREQDIELSLEPGLYVLKISAGWKEKGNINYGFLLEVQPEHPERSKGK